MSAKVDKRMLCERCGGWIRYPANKLCPLCSESQGELGCAYPATLMRDMVGRQTKRRVRAEI
jgi:hypothetical protein